MVDVLNAIASDQETSVIYCPCLFIKREGEFSHETDLYRDCHGDKYASAV